MIRVLIVEDEVLARLGLHQLVDWSSLGYELLEDAKTGKEALEKIVVLHPEIILLDLNMPGISGLDIQKYIFEHHLTCQTIVISCNEDFSTVKDVMRYGAMDFLRKLNLNAADLIDALNRCKQKIMESSSPSLVVIDRSEDVTFSYESLFKPNYYNRCFSDSFSCVACIVPQFNSLNFQEAIDLCKILLQESGTPFRIITKGDRGIYLLFKHCQSLESIKTIQEDLALLWNTSLHVSVCMADIQNLSDLSHILSIVDCIYVYAYYDSPDEIINVHEVQSFCSVSPFDFNDECNRIKQALAHFFSQLRSHDMLTENLLKRMFIDVLSLYSATAQNLHGSLEEVYLHDRNYHYQTIMQLNSINLTEQWFDEFSKVFLDQFFIRFKCSNSDILQKVIDYIERNINQPIQLASTAKSIGVSEAYLSTLFKKEIGQNFITYVNMQKIQRAKVMIEDGSLAYQVSESLGFDNYSYFSKTFKKYTGMTPDSFRKNIGLQQDDNSE